jgi:Ca-activated chloride channel family protein
MMTRPTTARRLFLKAMAGIVVTYPAALRADQADPFRISIDVDHVVLHVTVQDGHGGFIAGLESQDFSVYENGRPQEIRFFHREDVPVTVGMVVDNSGSMRTKRSSVIEAARSFAGSSNPDDEMFLVDFNERVWMGLPDTEPFTTSRSELEAALERMAPGGRTALYDAIMAGLQHLALGSKDKKVLIVVSDGGDNTSSHTIGEVLRLAGRSNAIIYTIGLFDSEDADRNPRILRRIATETGGEFFLPPMTSQVKDACNHIAREIRNQYTIGYSSDNPSHDGHYRHIKVVLNAAKHRDAHIRARTGYFAPGV